MFAALVCTLREAGALRCVSPDTILGGRVVAGRDLTKLIEACARGDQAAWSRLVSQYEDLVFSTALQTGLDHEAAVDVFQQVWLELHRSLLRLRDPQALPKWLIVTTRRLAYKQAVTRNLWLNEVREDLVDPTPGPESTIVAMEERGAVEAAMQKLDSRCREVLRMFFYTDDKPSYRTVAAELGLAEDSVGSLKTRCLDRLRDVLEGGR